MKTYQVGYNLGGMYHSYRIEAENEAIAIQTVLNKQYHPELLHGFTIKQVESCWG